MKKKNIILNVVVGLSILISSICFIIFGSKSILFKLSVIFFMLVSGINLVLFRKNISKAMKRTKVAHLKFIESFSIMILMVSIFVFVGTFDFNFDWTSNQLFNLSKETKTIIKQVEKPTTITLFSYPDGTQAISGLIDYAEKLGKRYEAINPKMIKFEKTDPVRDKAKAEEYSIQQNGTIVFEQDGKREYILPNLLIESQAEGEISYKGETIFSAILSKLNTNKETQIYTLTGHGEVNFNTTGLGGYDQAKKMLIDRRYKVKALNLDHNINVPEDTDLLVIADPKTSFSPQVLSSVTSYIENGGGVLYLVTHNTAEDINILLMQSGFIFLPNVAVDPARTAKNSGKFSVIPTLSPKSEITTLIRNKKKSVVFPNATLVSYISEENLDPAYLYDVNPLVKGSDQIFGERDFAKGLYQKDNNDIIGLQCLGLSSIIANKDDTAQQRRAVVIGSISFIDNARIFTGGNAELLLNSVDFIIRKDLKTTIAPKNENVSNNVPQPYETRLIAMLVTVWLAGIGVYMVVRLNKRRNRNIKQSDK